MSTCGGMGGGWIVGGGGGEWVVVVVGVTRASGVGGWVHAWLAHGSGGT